MNKTERKRLVRQVVTLEREFPTATPDRQSEIRLELDVLKNRSDAVEALGEWEAERRANAPYRHTTLVV